MEASKEMSQEILGLEKKYWKAMQEHDLKTAIELTDFPCIVASPHGIRSVDEDEYTKMFNSNRDSSMTLDIDEDEAQVRLLGPETAVIAYSLKTSFTKDGKDYDMSAIDTSTWIKRNNKWVCAMHTEIEVPKH